ncbi:cytochrome p450 [Marasmius crinis-equi]|uniref:Cytochrome p450 n=1 Tax=Marasmius crinis-equi TaxID=585013 RepID=A0ABR3EZ19_9AGAR
MYSPSATIVNVFPILRHLPLSFPIFKFQEVAAKSQKLTSEMLEVPFEFVRHNMESGSDKSSLLRKFLELNDADGGDKDQEFAIKGVCATAYAAGSDTTVASIEAFFLAMGMYPDIQKKAQAELEKVIGSGRIPGYEQRPNLPYIEAIFRETLRWSPVVPLGLWKATSEEDIVDGYYVPKGATVINNIWAISRDEAIYPDPESFNPERFLKEDGTCNDDDTMFIFGAGRRICPGRHFASATLWLAITSVLVEFDVGKPTTLDGKEVRSLEDVNDTDGFLSHPNRFMCSITPRSRSR